MPPTFRWDFEEDEDPRRQPDLDIEIAHRPRRWLRRGAVLLVGLLIVSFGVRRLLTQRQRALAEIESGLRASVELELRTIAERDVELFRSRQDPADPTWRERQAVRYVFPSSSRYTPAPGLEPADRDWEIRDIRLLGQTARVEMIRWFQESIPQSADTLLPFHLTWFYVQTKDGIWYHVAPLDDGWRTPYLSSAGFPVSQTLPRDPVVTGLTLTSGKGARREGEIERGQFLVSATVDAASDPILSIRATQTEAELLDPVAAELGEMMAQACDWLNCPVEARYYLSFEDVPAPDMRRRHWVLPYVYHTGRPANDQARTAWERSLKLWLVEALAQTQVTDSTVARRLVYDHLVRRLQVALGLTDPVALDLALLAQAVAAGEQHTLSELWDARRNPGDPEGMRLFDVEVAALLGFLERRVGIGRLFERMPTLRVLYQPGEIALPAVTGVEWSAFRAAWNEYLYELTGAIVVPISIFPRVPIVGAQLDPPPAGLPSRVTTGDDLALLCDGQVWVANADGSDMTMLTPPNQRFTDALWSPDGRSLLTRWLHNSADRRSALYWLAADGSQGRLLTTDPLEQLRLRGVSPDGRFAIYQVGLQARVLEVETGVVRRLPGVPVWSVDGERMIYTTESPSGPWLSDGDWANPRRIASREGISWQQPIWSPDGNRVAMTVHQGHPFENTIAIYDLATERVTSIMTIADLLTVAASADGQPVTNGADFRGTDEKSPVWVWPLGWAADGGHLLVWGQWSSGPLGSIHLTLLAAVAVDGSASYIVAYGADTFLGSVSWSPTEAGRMIFGWRTQDRPAVNMSGFLFDREAGQLYSATDVRHATWSPDGAWVAFAGREQITIIDRDGRDRFVFPAPGSCTQVAWNPAADLTALSR